MSTSFPTGIHFFLTYKCSMECDHCFVYCSPRAKGTFTLDQIKSALDELEKIKSVEWIYFEGGEPFLFYSIMLEGIRYARDLGFKTGIVTNAYWAKTVEEAERLLKPLHELGLGDLSVSDDALHFGDQKDNPAKIAYGVARGLGITVGTICIERPEIDTENTDRKGEMVMGGGALLKGRAVEKLANGLPGRNYDEFTDCPEEELRNPGRVHIDPYGFVHLCQGLVIGNMFEIPLSTLIMNYDAESHPICGPLLKGGPALLAEKYDVKHDEKYVSACHLCYIVRRSLLDKFPEYLAPRQIYGLEME